MNTNIFSLNLYEELRTNIYDYLWIFCLFAAIVVLLICIYYINKRKRDSATRKTYLDLIKHKPKDKQNYTSTESHRLVSIRYVLLIVSMFLSIVYICWRIFVSLPIAIGWVAVVLSLILLIVEIIEFYDSFVISVNQMHVYDYHCPKIKDDEYPDVDVFICTYNESNYILRKTINGCVHMQYPTKDKVHIYVCDDGDRTQVRKLAKEMGVNYISRKDNKDAKAGNLNNALSKTKSQYVATFDADMIPKSDFLLKTIPYFVDAKNINNHFKKNEQISLGFVQSPQHFYQPDLFQESMNLSDRVVGEQEFFHNYIQKGKAYSNCVYCCGTNIVYSRDALESIGGFYTKTVTEDIATGLLIQDKGYVSVTTPDVLAQGLNPNSFSDLIKQRKRWACGCVSTCTKLVSLKSKMSISQKFSFNSIRNFWYYPFKSIIVLLLPIITAVFGLFVFQCSFLDLLLFWGITYLFKTISWKSLNSKKYSYTINKVSLLSTSFSLVLPLLKEVLGIKKHEFVVTNKESKLNKDNKQILLQAFPFFIVFVTSLITFIYIILDITAKQEWSMGILAIWLLYNVFFMMLCLFVVLDDSQLRTTNVSKTQHSVNIFKGSKKLTSANVLDYSEQYIDLQKSDVYNVEPGDKLKITFDQLGDKDKISCLVSKYNNKQIVRLEIKNSDDLSNQFLEMLYDEPSDLPKKNQSFTFLFILWRSIICRLIKG